jgi:hypothetical protein
MYTHAFARPLIARYRTVGLAGIPLSSLLLRGLANLLIGYEFLVSIFNYRGRDIGRGTGDRVGRSQSRAWHSESAANLLIYLRCDSTRFSECPLVLQADKPDFDSATVAVPFVSGLTCAESFANRLEMVGLEWTSSMADCKTQTAESLD